MLTLVFAAAAIICGVGWLTQYIASATFAAHMLKKGLPLPSDEEWREEMRWVTSHLLQDLGIGRKN